MISITPETNLITALPALQIGRAMQILTANDTAQKAGILPGMQFPVPFLWEKDAFLLLHERRLCSPENTPELPGAGEPLRLRIGNFHGFHLAYISYQHTLSENFAEVVLFHSYKEYLSAAPHLSKKLALSAQKLEEYLDALEMHCDVFLKSHRLPPKEMHTAIRELSAAALFLVRIFSPALPLKARQRFRLSALLSTYLSRVLPGIAEIDCHPSYNDTSSPELLLPLDPSALFLLLTILFRILSGLCEDQNIDVSLHSYGPDGEIRFSAATHRSLPTLSHITDFSALAAFFPQMEVLFLLADYLSGIEDFCLDFFSDDTGKSFTLSLFIPSEKALPDFKSPLEEEAALEKAARCLKGILFLERAGSTPGGTLTER